MKQLYIVIAPQDNVAVALADLKAGEAYEGVELHDNVARGHKFALQPIAASEQVVKYGHPIGHATRDIKVGEWVHTHNMATNLPQTPALSVEKDGVEQAKRTDGHADMGGEVYVYVREDGRVGVRNELWIIPTVGCIAGQAEVIRQRIMDECDLTGVDDVVVLGHSYGCSQLGDDHANTRRALAALATHPNAGGVLLMGLGCENNQMKELLAEVDALGLKPVRMRHLVAQEVDDEVQRGFEACCELIDQMHDDRRQLMPLSMLRVGLKCGGSDGLSGITANPLLGRFTDILTAQGGTAVLTEVPEMFGAEHLLMERAESREVFDKTVALVNDFKDYFISNGQPVGENPSPGNKEGGITTLEEKSLGCVQKGGHATVTDVLQYAEPLRHAGLNLLCAPGNDLVASTALAISGCHIVLFTTGRGTPFGTVVPTMKVSTNTALAQNKPRWIDFNAGTLIEGESQDEAVQRLMAEVVAVASGKRLHHEDTHSKQIAIFKNGVTL